VHFMAVIHIVLVVLSIVLEISPNFRIRSRRCVWLGYGLVKTSLL
jgi:hypothetical protein